MKIVILTSETPSNVWLVNRLMAQHEVVGIVIERRPLALTSSEKSLRRRRMLKRYGYLRTLNKLLFNKFRSQFLASADDAVVRQKFFPDDAPIAYAHAVPSIVVENINDAVEFVRCNEPEVLAVCGTTVLKPKLFTLPPKGTVNIHTGITPEYRSADPIFWALYCGEPDKVGVTIHFVDKGIDTGAIICQESIPVYATDSLTSLYVRCIQRGAELYSRALLAIEAGSVATVARPGVVGRSFRSIELGIVQYLLFWLRFRSMRTSLPASPESSGGSPK